MIPRDLFRRRRVRKHLMRSMAFFAPAKEGGETSTSNSGRALGKEPSEEAPRAGSESLPSRVSSA